MQEQNRYAGGELEGRADFQIAAADGGVRRTISIPPLPVIVENQGHRQPDDHKDVQYIPNVQGVKGIGEKRVDDESCRHHHGDSNQIGSEEFL